MKGSFFTKQSKNGITLIALVVTIVVLLILAGVSIAMLAGEDGIIRQAQNAKDKTKEAEIEEKVRLAINASRINGYGNIDTTELQKELEKLGWDGDVTAGFPATGKINGMNVTIEANGDVTVTEGTLSDDDTPKTLASLKASEEPVEGNTTLEDTNGDSITIPDGFNIDKDSPIVVEEGIVIEDSQENQYVWIPVFEKSEERTWGADYATAGVVTAKTAERTSFTTADYTAIQTALETYTVRYSISDYSDVWYGDEDYGKFGYYNGEDFIYYTNGNMSENEYNALYQNMLVSVYKNGGFYIGKYEMGTGVATSVESAQDLTREAMTEYKSASYTKNDSVEDNQNEQPSIQGMPTPVSKANAVGYTYITQSQAQMLAEKMGEEYGYGNTTSSLMFGVQWDAVCVFLEKYGALSDGTKFDSSYLTGNESELWGNYCMSTFLMDRGYYKLYGSGWNNLKKNWTEKTSKIEEGQWLCTTGASDQNSALNIYDIGGNLDEFTLERSNDPQYSVTGRGSCFTNYDYFASSRSHYDTFFSDHIHSARPTLWL